MAKDAAENEENINGKFVRTEIIAQIFGVTVRRVQQLTQEGIIKTTEVPKEGRRYELVSTMQTYIQYLSNKAYGRGKPERESELKQQKLEVEIALKEAQEELHRMKCDIMAGKYIATEEVSMDYQKFFAVFKRFALGIPSRLISMISDSLEPLEARRVEKEMGAEVKRMLHAFVISGCSQEKQGEEKSGRKRAKT